MILYIMRHGETAWNKARRMQGQTDIPLTEEGLEMARKSGVGMKDLPIDLCISSPLSRAKQTAECVIGDRSIPLITDKRIQEISFGEWEGQCVLTENTITPGYLDVFYTDPILCGRPPGGEIFRDVLDRTENFLKELSDNPDYADKHILISSHGAAGRCLLAHFFDDPENIWRGCIPPNCAVSTVEVTDGVRKVHKIDQIFY